MWVNLITKCYRKPLIYRPSVRSERRAMLWRPARSRLQRLAVKLARYASEMDNAYSGGSP